MKKILSVLLVVALICIASVTAFADAKTGNQQDMGINDTTSADVEVVYVNAENQAITTVAKVYSVDVTFGDLELEWQASNASTANGLVWNPDTHTYVTETAGETEIAWVKPADVDEAVVIENHSNAVVTVAAAFEDNTLSATDNGLTATLSTSDALELESADTFAYEAPENPDKATYKLATSGERPEDPQNGGFTIGKITVTLSAE